MTISTYTDLQNAIGGWLDHSLFAAQYGSFIQLFETTANRRLRVRQMEATTTLTPSSGSVALPSDYLAWRRVTWTGSTRIELEYVEPSYLQAAYPSQPSAEPRVFSIEGGNLLIRPIDGTALEFDYYAKIPALATTAPQDGTQTNWLLTAHPDLYLFGSLVEAEMFGVNDERAPLWKARRDEIFEEIAQLSNKSRAGGGIRVIGPNP
jgi:hypothetical protein